MFICVLAVKLSLSLDQSVSRSDNNCHT